ncbi:hypothetical protein [Burkholderia sp. RS02]|uniref:hypothetical protein n=1 Tax=unclassified Burkholderia TaxID=2613784 RepID=UPI0032187B4A
MGKHSDVRFRFAFAAAVGLAAAGFANADEGAPSPSSGLGPGQRTLDAYAVYGNGRASEGGNMHWRAYEIGFGQALNDYASVFVAYLNEGHPTDNHRDGFALLGAARLPLGGRAALEFAAGPYFSMNTTHVGDEARNEKRLGIRASAALRYELTPNGIYLKAQYNRVQMAGGHSSDAVLFGIGSGFGGDPHPSFSDGRTQLSVWTGTSQTNRPRVPIQKGYLVELKRPIGNAWAYSASFVYEGVNDVAARRGVAAQFWYVAPILSRWSLSAGIGPYLAYDKSAPSDRMKLAALFSAQIGYEFTKDWTANLRFNRVATGNNTDQDMFMIGLAHNF